MSLLEAAISWLAPPQCLGCGLEGLVLCPACRSVEIEPYGERCWRCGTLSPLARTCSSCQSFGGPRRVYIATDHAGLAAKLIAAYKFDHQRFVAEALAQLLAETAEMLGSDELAKHRYTIVPLPSATSRRRQRGFDHIELLAKLTARQLGLPLVPALSRLGQSRQVGAFRETRLKQPMDKYFVRLPHLTKDRQILLIDDVITTGATLRAATKTLRTAGAKHVDGLVFAKRL